MRSEPAAALRGFMKAGSSAARRSALRRSKARRGMTTSPRTSNASGMPASAAAAGSIARGSERIVRALGVMTSPGHAVAAGETDGEAASAVAHRHRDAVELEFADVNEGFDSGQLARATVEVLQLLFVESVVEAEHCRGVLGFLRSRARRAADPLRRGFRGDQLGIRVLERLQALDQAVVLGVGYLGLVEDVIEMLVTANLCAQCFDLPDGGAARCLRGRFGRHRRYYKNCVCCSIGAC